MYRIEQSVTANCRRDVATVQQVAQSKFETTICEWQSITAGWLRLKNADRCVGLNATYENRFRTPTGLGIGDLDHIYAPGPRRDR
jgi:hypothetical protein